MEQETKEVVVVEMTADELDLVGGGLARNVICPEVEGGY